MTSDLLAIATVAKPHGIRGAVRILTRAEHVAFLRTLPDVVVAGTPTRVAAVAGTDERPIVTFESVADRTAAEQLRGSEVLARRVDLPEPEVDDDEYFRADLEGCQACALVDGRVIGVIIRVDILPANDVLVVRTDLPESRDILVPFIKDAVPSVDIAARTVTIDTDFLGFDVPERS